MAEWKRTKVGELLAHAIGGGWGADQPSGGTVPVSVIRGADFPDIQLQRAADLPLRYETAAIADSRRLEEGDIVLEISGGTAERPTGRTVRVTGEIVSAAEGVVIPASFCRLLRPDRSKIVPDFLYYSLQDLYRRGGTWEFQNQSTGLSNFQFKLFADQHLVPHPTLSEQRAIAEVLGALDDKIAANARIIQLTEALAAMRVSRLRPRVSLSALVSVSRATVDPTEVSEPLVYHYSLPAFDVGRGPERVAPAEIKSAKFRVDRPAVLVSKLNPRIPRIWDLATVSGLPALASTEFVVMHPARCSTTVLWALLSQTSFSRDLEGKVAGTSGSHQRVKPVDMLAAVVGDPDELSAADHDAIASIGQRSQAARAENVTLEATRDALLPALMSGTLRVRDAIDLVEETAT